tara:strand:+ start:87 stop:1055 length:969 start_codon:yes stop_codon:yes gene_type:complete
MDKKLKIGCAIPCYKGGENTIKVIKDALNYVDFIVLVDDKCPFNTGMKIEKIYSNSERVKVLFNKKNLGVGGSCKKAMFFLQDRNFEIIVKVDADGQINPHLIPKLIEPIVKGDYDAAKGNRFSSLDHILSMPKIRVFGNLGLSFLNKLSTGYWELFDPTNGFIAFKNSALKKLRLDKVDNRYFFESDLLFQCSLNDICFTQMPMKSIYSNEVSSLKPIGEIIKFGRQHIINFFKRIIYQYFLLDFNIGSFELLSGSITGIILIFFMTKIYLKGYIENQFATPGEANLIALLSIITVQLLLGFLYYDSTQQPLMRRLKARRK